MKKNYFGALALGLIAACSTPPYNHPSLNLIPENEYYSRIEKNTRKNQHYDGLMNILNYSATMLTSEVTLAQVDHQARLYQYSDINYQNEVGKAKSDLAKQTTLFLSFFVPEKKYDDLAKKSSKWKIFLDVAGQRYEAKITRLKNQLAELTSLYPDHTRWSTPYKLSFPVSTTITENGHAKLTITGPLISSAVEF
jgi:hypothetical protein